MADNLQLRQEVANLLAARGVTGREAVSIFHAVEWEMADGHTAVTFCLEMDEQRETLFPPSWGSWVPPVSEPSTGPPEQNPPDDPVLYPLKTGLHDAGGLEWMYDEGVRGCALVLQQVRETPIIGLDFSGFAAAGIDVYLRLGWGYADGGGTIAPPDKIASHCHALAETVNRAKGLAGVTFWNEVGNPSEWPGGWPNPTFVLSPQYVASAYVSVCNLVTVPTPLSPPPIDPYNVVAAEFGQPADPKVWAQTTYHAAPRIDWIALHAKTQGSNLGQIYGSASWEVFGDPIAGRYQHLRTIEDQLEWIPADLRDKPVVITEVNPQRKANGDLGWDANGPEWWRRATRYLEAIPQVAGAMAYRYEIAGGGQEPFGLEKRADILEAIKS